MTQKGYTLRMQGAVADLSIVGDINWWQNNSTDFARQLADLQAAGATELRGYINTGGGSMWEANEIYNLITAFPGRKTCRLGALVASAGTTIACAFADGIEMAANGQYMIHNPSLDVSGGEKELKAALQLYENVRQGAIAIYVKRTGLPADEVAALMEATTWMTAATAKAKGFVTAISGEAAELPADTAEVLNKYGYAGVPTLLNQALQVTQPAPVAAPANRAAWTLQDWQTHDSAGLALEMRNRTPLFQQLYQQFNGSPWQEPSGKHPQQGPFAQPAPVAAPDNRAAWTLQDWQTHDSVGLAKMIQAETPLFQQLHQQAFGRPYNRPGSHNKQ